MPFHQPHPVHPRLMSFLPYVISHNAGSSYLCSITSSSKPTYSTDAYHTTHFLVQGPNIGPDILRSHVSISVYFSFNFSLRVVHTCWSPVRCCVSVRTHRVQMLLHISTRCRQDSSPSQQSPGLARTNFSRRSTTSDLTAVALIQTTMASQINIYSQYCRYRQFELLISTIRIVDIGI